MSDPRAIEGSTSTGCDGVVHDEDYFLNVLRKVLPENYLAPFFANPGTGLELFQGQAALFSSVSQAIEHIECGAIILFAEGGALAVGQAEFSRPMPAVGVSPAVTVKRGTVIQTNVAGRQYTLLTDVVFGVNDQGPHKSLVQAVGFGWEWNLPAAFIDAAGEAIQGPASQINTLVEDPPYGDPTIVVRQLGAYTGGKASMLDTLGADRGVTRRPGEPDVPYRARIRSLPDTISPAAILRFLHNVLDALRCKFQFTELWNMKFQTCWNALPPPAASSPWFNPDYDPNLFVWNDPRPLAPYRNRWLDSVVARGAFVVAIQPLQPMTDYGMIWNGTDTGPDSRKFPDTGGRIAVSAWSLAEESVQAPDFPGAWNGVDLAAEATYAGIWQSLRDIKAGGVAALIALLGVS